MLTLLLSSFVKIRSGTFSGQCKLTDGTIPTAQTTAATASTITLLKKGGDPTNPSDLKIITFDSTLTDKELANQASLLLTKSYIEFEAVIDEYPKTLRYEGKDTGKLSYKVNGAYMIAGATQTIWGGSNTAYMQATPNASYVTQSKTDGVLSYSWDISKQQLFASKKVATKLSNLMSAYQKSAVYKYFKSHEDTTTIDWTTGITASSVKKYWPKTRYDETNKKYVKGGPKHGEMIVATAVFVPAMNCGQMTHPYQTYFENCIANKKLIPSITTKKDGSAKYTIPTFKYQGESYSIYDAANVDSACMISIFTTYDIYWNLWVIIVSAVLMGLALIVIIPTKCFDVKKYIQSKKAQTEPVNDGTALQVGQI